MKHLNEFAPIILITVLLFAIVGCTGAEPGYFVINVNCKYSGINQQYTGNRVFIHKWILSLHDVDGRKEIQDDCTLTYYELRNIRKSNQQKPKNYIKYNNNYGLVYSHQIKISKEDMIKQDLLREY